MVTAPNTWKGLGTGKKETREEQIRKDRITLAVLVAAMVAILAAMIALANLGILPPLPEEGGMEPWMML